jgi:6-phosphofructokinase 1
MVDVGSEYYGIARRYMIRLSADDFDDPHELAKYAATAGISLDEFRQKFHYLVEPAEKDSSPDKDRAVKFEKHLHEEVV